MSPDADPGVQRRVLMTGMGGFIGRHTAAALRLRGAEVVDARQSGAYDFLQAGDRARAMDGMRADTLVHLAWVTDHGSFWTDAANEAWAAATVDLAARFWDAGGRRVVAVGSGAEYDWSQAGAFSESMPLVPHTPYGKAKAKTGEALLRMAEDRGASAAWARVFFLFGTGEAPGRLVPSALRACLEKTPLACGPAPTVRDFWDVRNVGGALAALALADLSGPLNVASGAGVSLEEFGAIIEKITGVGGMLRYGARPLSPGDPQAIVADATRLQSELGFDALVSFESGLEDYWSILRGGTGGA